MFIGHLGVALAAKKATPKTSLGTLFMAAQFLDLLWPIFLVLGLEQVKIDPGNTVVTPLAFVHYPISHSLLTSVAWGSVLSVIYWTFRHDTRGAVWIGVLAISHWILDAIAHRPDLPLYPGSKTFIGLGLWHSLVGTIVVECILFATGIVLYLRTTRAKDKNGIEAFWSLMVLLVLVYFGNLFGPPPPNLTVLEAMGLAGWLLIIWGYWIDRHRTEKSSQ